MHEGLETSKSCIYKPREDTYLLSDAIASMPSESILEVGVGSGYVLECIARRGVYAVGTDIDLQALFEAKKRLRYAGLKDDVDLVCCDAAEAFREACFESIVFNPPYLPSEGLEDRSVDGGADGIGVAWRIFQSAVRALRSSGRILFITSSICNIPKLHDRVDEYGFELKILESRRLFFEELYVYEARKHESL